MLLTGGQQADCQSAAALLANQRAQGVIADKGYDTDEIRGQLKARRMKVVIPAKRNRKRRIRHDQGLYAERNQIERCFGKLKRHRRIATRYDRNDAHYLGFLYLACALLWLN